MRIEQISVFVENKAGRLVSVLKVLEEKNISIHALSINETAEFGIIRMILDNPKTGREALREAGFTTRTDVILTAEIPDVPGGLLNSVAMPLSDAGVNLKYFYAYIEPSTEKTMAVIKPDDVEKAEAVLESQQQ